MRPYPDPERVLLVCDATAIVSDANWSYSALTAHRGASVRIEDADFADGIAAWWDTLQGISTQQ